MIKKREVKCSDREITIINYLNLINPQPSKKIQMFLWNGSKQFRIRYHKFQHSTHINDHVHCNKMVILLPILEEQQLFMKIPSFSLTKSFSCDDQLVLTPCCFFKRLLHLNLAKRPYNNIYKVLLFRPTCIKIINYTVVCNQQKT